MDICCSCNHINVSTLQKILDETPFLRFNKVSVLLIWLFSSNRPLQSNTLSKIDTRLTMLFIKLAHLMDLTWILIKWTNLFLSFFCVLFQCDSGVIIVGYRAQCAVGMWNMNGALSKTKLVRPLI